MSGVQDLLRHLRSNPGDGDVAALSAQFGVESKLVEVALKTLPKESRARPERAQPLRTAADALGQAWSWLTANKVLFLLGSSAVASLVLFLSGFVQGNARLSGANLQIKTSGLIGLAVFAFFPIVQFVALAKYDRCRYALLGGAAFGLAIAIPTTSVAAAVGVFAMYVFVACPVVVAGAYVRMRKEGRQIETMSRQESLERLLAVRAALADPSRAAPSTVRPARRFQSFVERNVVWLTFVFSAIQTLVSSAVLTTADPGRQLLQSSRTSTSTAPVIAAGLMILIIALSLFSYFGQFYFGFCSPRARKTLVVVAAYLAPSLLNLANPYAYVSWSLYAEYGYGNLVAGFMAVALLVFVGTVSRQLYDNAAWKARRNANDPDVLMAEMVELEWRLTPKSSEVTVMAVDVVGSTAMKQDADPLVTEWSFREYQKWVESVCARHGGKIESTAGDGAIVGFEDPEDAASAALEIQAGIDGFNTDVNRMKEQFRLRIGIHMGNVQGELGDVQFTRVIDVAAHIEAKAPVGGIAVSEVVAAALGSRSLTRSEDTIDGHEVYVLADPRVLP